MGLESAAAAVPEPPQLCALCPRLVGYRGANQEKEPQWFNGAVPSFGSADARLLIVGLAPGLNGANRTGRPFTGDYAGDLLYATLLEFGFAKGHYDARPDDGLSLVDCMITNAVRCVPPENKPTPAEIATLPAFPQSAHRNAAQPRCDFGAGTHCPRQHAWGFRLPQVAVFLRPRQAPRTAW